MQYTVRPFLETADYPDTVAAIRKSSVEALAESFGAWWSHQRAVLTCDRQERWNSIYLKFKIYLMIVGSVIPVDFYSLRY